MRRNPLRKRILRELKSEAGKFFVIFFLLVSMIGLVSGFTVADTSMITAYNEGFNKYHVEHGFFELEKRLLQADKTDLLRETGITVYDKPYAERTLNSGCNMRIFPNREEVDLACVMDGRLPEVPGEIAVDRMWADNNDVQTGDTLSDEKGDEWLVTGLVALPDYSCLFEKNSDSMFDSLKFGVGVVAPDAFALFDEEEKTNCYAFRYDAEPKDDIEEKEWSEKVLNELLSIASVQQFVPRFQNKAIIFTGNDMGHDRVMIQILLYIIIAILAFVFAVTITNTIQKEANVIGTLRATGYTRGELVRHYMTMPIVVTLIGAIVGNILGYTFFKDFCANMYYGSYSLPSYVTIWSPDALINTTVIPVIIMVIINLFVLSKQMRLSPLKFLRRDLSRRRNKKAFPLSHHIPFMARFRLRVIGQNLSNYLVMFIGILFSNFLLLFGMMFPEVLSNYNEKVADLAICDYQYLLEVPAEAMNTDDPMRSLIAMARFSGEVETENEDAEKFSAYSLKTGEPGIAEEEVLIYGIAPDSRYVYLPEDRECVVISRAFSEKYDLYPGETITLKESFEDKTYDFTVTDVNDYMGGVAIFMPKSRVNERFDLGKNYFSGYFSASEITDIDEGYIGSVIDVDALTKISRQLLTSMGDMMYLVDAIAVLIFVVMIYLLSKLIIEKNAQSISMTKILGYRNRQIALLYIIPTSIVVVASLAVTIPLISAGLQWVFHFYVRSSMSGWFAFEIRPVIYARMFLTGMISYGVVAFMELFKVRRVPMEEALKNVE